MTLSALLLDGEYLLRIALAAVLGAVIGIERELRMKDAGIRTHLIVALSSCLMMLVSKYGFYDMLGLSGVGLDPSRVAASIVSGIGFLGAGVIFTRGRTVNGLTTAAGLWATVGVGMAVGAGMYIVSGAASILILIVQAILHKNLEFVHRHSVRILRIRLSNGPEALQSLCNALEARHMVAVHMRLERDGQDSILVETEVQAEGGLETTQLTSLANEVFIQSVEW